MEKTKRKTGGIAKFIEEAKHYRDNPAVLNNIIEAMSEKIDELEAKAAAYDLAVQENVAHEFTILQALKGRTDYEGLPVSEINWLQVLRREVEKAKDYDRLMSGGRKTLKEWANFLGKCFAVDPDGFGYSFGSKPIIKDEHWWPDGDRIAYSAIRPDLIDFNGDWKNSLTLPDGLEEQS